MTKIDLSKYDNSWYNHGSLIRRILWIFIGRVFVNTYLPLPTSIRIAALRLFGSKIGKGVMIKPKVNVKYPWLLEIGDFAWIGEKVWIDNLDLVKIGSHCCISQGVLLLTGNHDFKSQKFDLIVDKINIGDGVWIGAKSIVTQGVNCGSHSVLGAGSLLTKSISENEIWAGNPAEFKKLREIK
jgi:putative colanic acid biosynthesis acetyltransferase WcaF